MHVDSDARARERFQSVLGAVATPSLLMAPGRVIGANGAATELLGISEAGLSERGLIALGADAEIWSDEIERVLSGAASSVSWSSFVDARGERVAVDVKATSIQRDGAAAGDLVAVVQIDAGQALRADLRAAEELFRRTFDAAPIGMALVALDGRFLRVNEALSSMLGRSSDELLTLTFQDITHPADLDADLDLLASTLRGDRTGYTMEKRYFHQSGDQIWADLTVALLRDEHGAPRHFVAQIQDITERRQVEAELLSARAQLEGIVAHAAIPLAVVSPAGVILDANHRFATMFGFPAGTTGTVLRPLLHPDSWRSLSGVLESVATGSVEDASEEVVVLRGDEPSLVARLELATLPGESPAVIVQAVDITSERHARMELERLASHDELTGLLNRRAFYEELCRTLEAPDERVAVLYLDLDGFKAVNDGHGHSEGDRLLRDVARALRASVREVDRCGRLGGDEFAVLVNGVGTDEVERAAGRIGAAIAQLRADTGSVTASIGIAAHRPGSAEGAEQLLARADDAMYVAKRLGLGRQHLARS
jgi:diguanylate cyclase (GGDEF)-like protein/PAS domain S-box-containing protein